LSYKVLLHKNAQKGLLALRNQPSLLKKIDVFFEALSSDPSAVQAKKLKGEWEGCYSYRTGVIRIIYEILNDKLIVYVLDVGPSGGIY
jgi:mRNA interferase RelE/StbE